MHDNARPHTAEVVSEALTLIGIDAMDWPARSPDLNPIEHVWDNLGKRVRRRAVVPETLNELRAALQEEWEGIAQEDIARLIRSMPRHFQKVIIARIHAIKQL